MRTRRALDELLIEPCECPQVRAVAAARRVELEESCFVPSGACILVRHSGRDLHPRALGRRHVESVYVLAGELTFALDGRRLTATEGTWVQIPAGVAHEYACTGRDEARFLELHTPSCGYGAYLRTLAGFDQELV